MKLLEEFKSFALKGNVTDMAIGVIIGGAFGKIVSSLVNDVVMPVIGVIIGGVNFTNLKWTIKNAVLDDAGEIIRPAITVNWGNFIQVVTDFLIIAIVIFAAVKLMNRLRRNKEKESVKEAPKKSSETILLEEIRDLLKERKS